MTIGLGVAGVTLAPSEAAAGEAEDFDVALNSINDHPSIAAIEAFAKAYPNSPLIADLIEALPENARLGACNALQSLGIAPETFEACLGLLESAAGPEQLGELAPAAGPAGAPPGGPPAGPPGGLGPPGRSDASAGSDPSTYP
jgi:hypothetical protein